MVWRMLHASGANPYWAAIDHFHNFSRAGVEALLAAEGFRSVVYGVDENYRSGMEIIARKI
jgi:protein O-GlcNAc transferase